MSDLIDRQDLIKALETDCSWEIFDDWGNRTPTGQAIIETIKNLPSAETECTCCEYRVGDLCCYSDVKTDMEAMEEGEEDG